MSSLKLFNTLTAQKEDFVPLNGNKVSLYSCGPTVYDSAHLGHARMALTFDVIQRYLRFAGYDVTFVRNITDVDDKIITRAKERGWRPEQIAREYTFTFWRDMRDLNVQSPDVEPRCTEYMGQIIDFIKGLIDKGHAYAVGGDVYFDVASAKNYGQLKKQSLDDLMMGAREDQVRSQDELKERKRSPIDFALWKGADPGEAGWQSPWGWGRPGWHIECSAMVKHVLGETIDIHGGGQDLIFPHHENEIAQSESLHDRQFARYWLHNNFLVVNAEKMSKSLGNFKTIQDVLETYSPDAVRMFLLQTHYRSPINMDSEAMNAAKAGVSRLIRASRIDEDNADLEFIQTAKTDRDLQSFYNQFVDAMNDDFHTPQAVAVLFSLADQAFANEKSESGRKYSRLLKHLAGVLGFTLTDTSRQLDMKTAEGVLDLVLQLRQSARERKDFQTSDQIRDGLQDLGIKIMDVKSGQSTWERI